MGVYGWSSVVDDGVLGVDDGALGVEIGVAVHDFEMKGRINDKTQMEKIILHHRWVNYRSSS